MSLILEALRKSESERQLGRVPGLLTPMPVATRVRRRWSPLAAAVPALLMVAAAGWWFGGAGVPWRQPSPATVEVASPPATAPTAMPMLRPMPAADPDGPVEASAPSKPTTPASTRSSAAVPDETRLRTADQSSPATDTGRDIAAAPVNAMPAPATTAADSAAATASPASTRTLAPPPAPVIVPPPAATAPAQPIAAAGQAPIATAAPPEPPLPTLATLDTARRSQLPPLRMSLHVFAETPAQRFALIDGRRYTEGQSIDALLQVHEIRREGVVLSLDGSRFLLPRP